MNTSNKQLLKRRRRESSVAVRALADYRDSVAKRAAQWKATATAAAAAALYSDLTATVSSSSSSSNSQELPRFMSTEAWALEHARHPERYLEAQPLRPLWDAQREMVARLAACEEGVLRGCILASETGSGKSQSLLQRVLEDGQARVRGGGKRFGHPTLVVVPKLLVSQWREQIEQAYAPAAMAVQVVHVSSDERARDAVANVDTKHLIECIDIVITTYDTLRAGTPPDKNGPPPKHGLFAIKWRRIIVDEATMLSNEDNDVFEACEYLQSDYRIYVTATPFPNGTLKEVRAVLAFLCYNGPPVKTHEAAAELLQRLHALVWTSPPLRMNVQVEERWLYFCDENERVTYRELAQVRRKTATIPKLHFAISVNCRKACDSTILLDLPEHRPRKRREQPRPSTKISAILHFAQQEMSDDDCAIVFHEYLDPLEELAYYLKLYDISYCMLHSKLSEKQRAKAMDICRGRAGWRPRFILLPLRLGGPGLDGLQYVANIVILMQSYWNETLDIQALGRIARFGQSRRTRCLRFCMLGTIEEEMRTTAREKMAKTRLLLGIASIQE